MQNQHSTPTTLILADHDKLPTIFITTNTTTAIPATEQQIENISRTEILPIWQTENNFTQTKFTLLAQIHGIKATAIIYIKHKQHYIQIATAKTKTTTKLTANYAKHLSTTHNIPITTKNSHNHESK